MFPLLLCCYGDSVNFRDIVVSNSSGKISKLAVSQDKLVELSAWNAHNYEAWIVTSDKWNGHVIYSGADDCRLLTWDTRGPCHQPVHCCKQCQCSSSHYVALV